MSAPGSNSSATKIGDSGDLGLRLPLHGLRLVEASAGTGKTFTLITVLLRLLLERGMPVAAILAVTFTRAAAAELRQRLRKRLRAARDVLDGRHDENDAEAKIAASVLAQAAAHATPETLRDRVHAALMQLDEATIATIHGFCQRALREFGFRAGALADLELLDSAPEVWDEVAADVWRRAASADDTRAHALLRTLWKTPDALARDLPALCDGTRLLRPDADESEHATALHDLRAMATARFDATMRARRARTQDQLLETVWRASEDETFATALAQRWPLLLIDEFQDTDPRQWALFQRMYAVADPHTRLLCLVGDPKQAIYRFRGGDLRTYLKARDQVRAQNTLDDPSEFALDANYRSRPALLLALERLFSQHDDPFREPDIRFHSLHPAGAASDDDLRLHDAPAPALTLHWLPQPQPDLNQHHSSAAYKGMRNAEDDRALMTDTAVALIADSLAHARLRGEPLKPSDIAVLTFRNRDAQQMQRALAAAGLAAAVHSGESVFAGEAADALAIVLRALAEPGDQGVFRAALATPLLGYDAAAIAALDEDTQAFDRAADAFERATLLWRSRGPLPALLPFATAAAKRWLGERGGARLLTDTLHLLERLQADAPSHHGPMEQVRWFAQMRARPGDNDRARLRLESDADLIQISTIHKAKGLEYGVVVLPYLAMKRSERIGALKAIDAHDDAWRPLRAWVAKDVLEPHDMATLRARADAEDAAEAQRLLYVALTRAKYAVHALWSRNDGTRETAMHWLLHAGASTGRKGDALDAAGMRAKLVELAESGDGEIAMRDAPAKIDASALARDAARAQSLMRDRARMRTIAPARTPRNRFAPELRLHSFSALHARSEAASTLLSTALLSTALPGADDEASLQPNDEGDTTLAGTGFGNAVHAVLEAADLGQWRLPHDAARELASDFEDRCPPTQRGLVERALLRQGLDAGPASLAQTARLAHRALNVRMPGGMRLCDAETTQLRREMGFHFRLRSTRLDALHALLETHGYPRAQALPGTRLEGLMHGYIDLVYRDASGRHYVVDYKTNRLPAYDPDALRLAVRQRDYDMQYLIYLVALRRWLRLRRGPAFDAERDIGGAVYLFLRGIALHDDDLGDPLASETDAAMRARDGVHFDPVSPIFLAALDALFDGGGDAK